MISYSTPTRFPVANLFSVSDPGSLVESAGASVHIVLNQFVEDAGSRLRLRPHVDGKLAA